MIDQKKTIVDKEDSKVNERSFLSYNIDTNIMIVILPDTGSVQYLRVRTMPSASSVTPFKVRLALTDKDTQKDISITNVTASYDQFDFLNVTASLNLSASHFYAMEIIQLSGSSDCTILYRGELFPTTESATVRNSDPFFSYTDNSNEYIVY